MRTKGTFRVLALLTISALTACGGAALLPQWTIEHNMTGSTRLIASEDKQSFYIVSGLYNETITISQLDLNGNTLQEHEHTGPTDSRYRLTEIDGNTIYLHNGRTMDESSLYIDLDTGASRPAFNNPPLTQYHFFTLRPRLIINTDTLIMTGSAQLSETSKEIAIIGSLTADGVFEYQELGPEYSGVYVYPIHNTDQFIMHSRINEEYRETIGAYTRITITDENLQPIREIMFDYYARVYGGFDDKILVRTTYDGTPETLVAISSDGSLNVVEDILFNKTILYGDTGFYTVDFSDNLLTPHKVCRHKFDLTRERCFNIPSVNGRPSVEVLEEDVLAFTTSAKLYKIDTVGVNLNNLKETLLGNLEATGQAIHSIHHKTYSPDGKLIMDASPKPFREIGRYELLQGFSYILPYLVAERYEPGACYLSDYLFLSATEVLDITHFCVDENNSQVNHVNYWR